MDEPLRIVPGASAGPFILGDSINQVIGVLRSGRNRAHIKVGFTSVHPAASPVSLRAEQWGALFVFAADSQRLVRIELDRLGDIALTFANSSVVFKAPTLLKLYNVLGPTHPGKRSGNSYQLQYNGLWLEFAAPNDGQEIPLELADKTSPLATRLVLHAGSNINLPAVLSPLTPCHVAISNEQVIVRLGTSVVVMGESSAQDVLGELGSPGGIHRKTSANVMLMHLGSAGHGVDYFFNYFDRGVDILFDGHKHVVKKVILRTNLPNRAEFNEYRKCCFKLEWMDNLPLRTVGCDDAWSDVESRLGHVGRAMVLDKGATANPFGPSMLFGYQRAVFEVAKTSGDLCSVCLF